MGGDDKFYKFEESSEIIGGGEERSRVVTKERVFFVVLVLALIAALIGVSVHFSKKVDDLEDANRSSNPDAQAGGRFEAPSTAAVSAAVHATAPTTVAAATASSAVPDTSYATPSSYAVPTTATAVSTTLQPTVSTTASSAIPATVSTSSPASSTIIITKPATSVVTTQTVPPTSTASTLTASSKAPTKLTSLPTKAVKTNLGTSTNPAVASSTLSNKPTSTLSATSTSSPTPKPTLEELQSRVDCIPEAQGGIVKVDQETCLKRHCLYSEVDVEDIPDCYFAHEVGYKVKSYRDTSLGFEVELEQKLESEGPFGDDLTRVVFSVEMRGDDIIRFTFDDPEFHRYKVPVQLNLPSSRSEDPKYEFKITSNDTFAFQVLRKSTGTVLWDTGVGGLVLSDQFLQLSTRIPSRNVYGFGENLHKSFRHDLSKSTTWPMFSRDQPPTWKQYANLYGVHPFYSCMEGDGYSHGVLLLNSNAQDYTLSPLPMLTYRTIGGILDFYMFLGPEPEHVVQQYTQTVGRPYMPPYWSLGFQLCRYGYNSLQKLQAAVDRTKQYNIPHDVQYADIDHMDTQKDFTVDTHNFAGLSEYFKGLRDGGMRTIIILDPTLISNETNYEPYDNLTAIQGAIKWPKDYNAPNDSKDVTNALLGWVWPQGKVVFPDFFKDKTRELWKRLIVKHRQQIPFDALWIDMNEPANFGTDEEKPWNWPKEAEPYWSLKCPGNNKYEDPPYRTKAAYVHDEKSVETRISAKTICMVSQQGNDDEYQHYDVHSLYGWSQTKPTLDAARLATGERSLVLSRSTYVGSGQHTGHWLGDNDSQWPDLADSIIGMLEFNLFGIPYIGADICGFWGNTTAEMCKRWMQLGAFYTFSRNHNGIDNAEQDPGMFGADVARASREALETRYWLLPYLYTLFHQAHSQGHTVVRPLFHEYPKDAFTYGIDRQFLWGHALMIVPILEKGQETVDYYIPDGVWYDFYDGTAMQGPANKTRAVSGDSNIGLLVRGGFILPMQQPANNTHFSRNNPMKLLVALSGSGTAEGDLFWDDGTSVDTYETGKYFTAKFTADMHSISMTMTHDVYHLTHLTFITIVVYGAPEGIESVYYDGSKVAFNHSRGVLTIYNLDVPLTKDFSIVWRYEPERHLDCYPEAYGKVEKVTKESCESRGCIYEEVEVGPWCYYDLTGYGYKVVGNRVETELGYRYHLQHKGKANPYSRSGSADIENLVFSVEMRGNDILRFKLYDANNTRYEVPVSRNLASNKASDPRYEIRVIKDPFSFQVIRRSNGEVLWDTSVGGLTFSDQFLQIATILPSTYVYGFGENVHSTFKHNLSYQSWPMWSRDQPVGWGAHLNHYGVHPFYTCMENGGHSHGVLLLNSNAQDYSFTPLPMLTYRTIGGILDFYMFLGPEPENVVQQYTGMIGRAYMPPYWALGFQLCRYGYNNIDNLQAAVNRTKNAGIPHDVQYADIDHMDERKDFTVDNVNFPGIDGYLKSLQSEGMHIIIILDPTLVSNVSDYEPYEKMRDSNSNIKWPVSDPHIPPASSTSNNDLLGYVWPRGKVVFPDFFKASTQRVWKELIVDHHENMLTFDGLWIDMNEPANFGTNEEKPFNWPDSATPYWSLNCTLDGSTVEHPPYRTMAAYAHDGNGRKAMLSDKTICMRAVQGETGEYTHYNVHSLYGWSETQPTLEGLRAATGERGIVITRSTFPGSGQYAGHWLGDNDSIWKEMRESIIGILEFNLFGIPYIGADICGFMGNTTAELCKRWMQLGAFYTFSRNHNGIGYIDQDPAVFGPDVAEASKVAMETRYLLLPYLYTLFHQSHVRGNTVIRPLHHQFPYDVTTYSINEQFMWGPALMISPILYQGQEFLTMYLPSGPWYDFYTGVELETEGSYQTIPVGPDSRIPLYVHAGHILPLQAPASNTHYSRTNPFSLKVALKDSENGGRGFRATGDLFIDDGVSIDTYENGMYYYARFNSGQDTLSMTIEHNNISVTNVIDSIEVLGVRTNVGHVYIGDKKHGNLTYNSISKVLKIMGVNLSMNEGFSLEWREYARPSAAQMDRLDCYPDIDDTPNDAARTVCEQRGCVFQPEVDMPFLPKCYLDKSKHGYVRRAGGTNDKFQLTKKSNSTLFGGDINTLQVQIDQTTDNMLRVKITDSAKPRYEVPVDLNLPQPSRSNNSALYDVTVSQDNQEFSIKVTRKSTGKIIWDTSAGPLIFSDQYLQISTRLPSDNFYGLGEHRHFHLKHSMDYKTWPIFTRDSAVNSPDFTNLYGAHPFYMNLEDDTGSAHAVLFLNSNAMEVLLDPQPRLTYRTIGGILDFYIFLGPEPETVIQQYTQRWTCLETCFALGLKYTEAIQIHIDTEQHRQMIGHPVMLPYWALGFQLCRWGYNSIDNMKAAVDRTREAGIPHDIQYADIDHMDERKDFTVDNVNFAGLSEYVKELQDGGMHFIIIIDPGIISNETSYTPYDDGVIQDVFIKWPNNTGPTESKNSQNDMYGYVWPKGKVVFPDFLLNRTSAYWQDQIVNHYKNLQFDGLWIDMNEPANFDTNGIRPWNWPEKDRPYWSLKCTLNKNHLDIPPYSPRSVLGDLLSEKTLCMEGLQVDGKYNHYDVHSLYGMSETQPTMLGLQRATSKRGIVISRSTYPTSGRYGGHWLGDNDSFWRNLHDSIIGIIEFNLFGIPYIGADICGFFSEPSPEMCQRWMQLGAFYTFSRNHNGLDMKEQDPAVHGRHVADSSRRSMEIRYSLLPYVYTLFYKVHKNGGTVIRAMMHEFPTDKRTWSVDTQFLWGHAFLIAPVLEQGKSQKDVYFPAARWFDYYSGREMIGARATLVTVEAPRDHIPLFLRGGYILPTQDSANNTVHSRRNPLGMLVVPDDANTSSGELFWDDGDSIDTIEKGEYSLSKFKLEMSQLTVTVVQPHSIADGLIFQHIWVYGVSTAPTNVTYNNNPVTNFTYNTDTQLLTIQDFNAPLSSNFTVSWR